MYVYSRTVTKATGESTARQIQAVCTLLVGLVLGFYASWKVAFVVLATFPIRFAEHLNTIVYA